MWGFFRKLTGPKNGAAALPVPGDWKTVTVHANACDVKAMTETQEPGMPLSNSAMLDGLAGRSQPVSQRTMSFIRTQIEINGNIVRLMSAGIPIDPQTLHMHILQKGTIQVSYNPADPAMHRFDLSFLL